MRVGILGLELECPAVAADRFIQLAKIEQGEAQVIERDRIVRFQLDRSTVMADRFVDLALVFERGRQVVVRCAWSGFNSSVRR